ncbi:FAD/NAD(P)-binding domain-containing protein [Marasmius fiardii PR-910]|nr:FAD/NAD(P)-binding domain-containing protein [Marasmius fiardii PR-910]
MAHKRICIVGAGPAGLASLKVILDHPNHKSGRWKVVCYESREGVGGIWNPAEPIHHDQPPLTPLYDSLTTNIPHPVMAYAGYPFPPSTPIFPPASTVQKYLEAYSSHFGLTPHIHFNHTVHDISWLKSQSLWKVTLHCGAKNYFDALIVASGHFRKPRYPDVDGLSDWLSSGCAIHSAWYRRPSDLGAQVRRVIVVGNGPSGQDIVADLRALRQDLTVFHSIQGASRDDTAFLHKRSGIIQLKRNKYVIFEDGTVETNIDLCIFATGYEMSFPFLSSVLNTVQPSSHSILPPKGTLWNSTYHIYPLAKHLFPMGCEFPPSSVAFVGLILRGTPLSLYEAQAHAILQVFSQPDSLNIEEEESIVQARRRQLGPNELAISQLWHKFTEPESFDYRDGLYKFAGVDTRVEDWEKYIWLYKVQLRREWQVLVRRRQADKWVSGVGVGGKQEWISLLRNILAEAGINLQ